MGHRNTTERAIADMQNVISLHRKGIIEKDVEEEARIPAENRSEVVLKLQLTSEKIVLEKMDTILNKLFNNCIFVKATQRPKCIKYLQKVIIYLS